MIGACYLHHGFEATAEATAAAFAEQIELASETMLDFKSALQELLARDGARVTYEVAREAGPPHDRALRGRRGVDGEAIGRGRGETRRPPSRPLRRRHWSAEGGRRQARGDEQNTVRSDREPSHVAQPIPCT